MILMGLCNESGGLCPVNNISAELCMSVRLGLPITTGALRWPPGLGQLPAQAH